PVLYLVDGIAEMLALFAESGCGGAGVDRGKKQGTARERAGDCGGKLRFGHAASVTRDPASPMNRVRTLR
ncbi:MAG: hypothetical protein KDI80_16115, partial [Xanthomonadales bacterium]|nr:hypothetical protein [Xanthomonadales bacterium]